MEPENKKPAQEASYSADELMNAARAKFGCAPEVVAAALKFYGIVKATVTEAMGIIDKFKKREVL